jgi:hypothetical protein
MQQHREALIQFTYSIIDSIPYSIIDLILNLIKDPIYLFYHWFYNESNNWFNNELNQSKAVVKRMIPTDALNGTLTSNEKNATMCHISTIDMLGPPK